MTDEQPGKVDQVRGAVCPPMTEIEIGGGASDGYRLLIEVTLDGAPPAELRVDPEGAVWADGRVVGQAEHPYPPCGQTPIATQEQGVVLQPDGVIGPFGSCIRPAGHGDGVVTEQSPHRAANGAKWWPL